MRLNCWSPWWDPGVSKKQPFCEAKCGNETEVPKGDLKEKSNVKAHVAGFISFYHLHSVPQGDGSVCHVHMLLHSKIHIYMHVGCKMQYWLWLCWGCIVCGGHHQRIPETSQIDNLLKSIYTNIYKSHCRMSAESRKELFHSVIYTLFHKVTV